MMTRSTIGRKPGDPVGYVPSEIPEFWIPAYDREREERER